ncbi:hypothetical protein BC831DRAFT_451295 [Entophlyctis helioformis]|nr:hypothetical protein BC831DRAFT_451295 [Entophlyctis helioformis]
MAPFHQKPENALKRAEELIAVSQHAAALNLLHEVILSKRGRLSPISVLEPIMFKFIELAVGLNKGKAAREALYQYKNVVQNVNVASIENTIKLFLELAEAKVAQAQAKADKLNLDTVDDLEAAETPESILLSTVSTDDSKDRTDRAVVTPWVRFLWEAYRTALDTIRNNARLEVVYQFVVAKAFNFCLKYNRKTEFRRLCEILRQHLASATKYAHQAFSIDLNDPDTLQRHLETRFIQLNAAAELEHWQEAFRTIEDIHNLMELSKMPPKAYMLANYYEKLARVFMVGENFLFHAAALNKYYSIMRQNKNLPQEEHERIASLVLVAALAIPIISTNRSAFENEEKKQHTQRLTSLLRVSQLPTREGLLAEALGQTIFPLARPEVKELYQSLEVQFHPLSICKRIAPTITVFAENADLTRYVNCLQQVILTRLLQQLSQVYSTIKIDAVVQLASFPEPYNVDAHMIEKFVMNGSRRGELAIRVDHKTRTLTFVTNIFASPAGATSEGPRLQAHPSQNLRMQLALLAKRLHVAVQLIHPQSIEDKEAAKVQAFQQAAANLEEERRATYIRRALIEKKKEMRESESAKKELEETRARTERIAREQAAEKLRLEEETRRREIERLEQQRRDIEKQEAQKLAEKLAGELREKGVGFNEEELNSMDKTRLVQLQVEQLEKERRELATKTKTIGKRIDHLERAFRKEEIPLLHQDYKDQQKYDREAFEAGRAARLEAVRAKHVADMALKARFARMVEDQQALRDDLQAKRDAEFKAIKKEAERKLAAAKEKRIKELRDKFEAEKRRRAQAAADAERAAEEARLAEEREEAEAHARKMMLEAKRKEEAERQSRLDETARKQREREAEVEERRRAELAARSAGPARGAAAGASAAPAQAETASWRRSDAASRGAAPVPAAAAAAASASGPAAAAAAPASNVYTPPSRRGPATMDPRGVPTRTYGGAGASAGSSAGPAPAAARPFGGSSERGPATMDPRGVPTRTYGSAGASGARPASAAAPAPADDDARFASRGPVRIGAGKWREAAQKKE